MQNSKTICLFDFDGTLIKGDLTKLAFKRLYPSKFSFVKGYYLTHLVGILILLFNGKDTRLRESRRLVLIARFDELADSEFIKQTQMRMFKQVYIQAKSYIEKGYGLVVISAGYSEIIRLILGNNLEYDLIANSIFEKDPEVINFENKVKRLNSKYELGYSVKVAYGNTKGDIPMLELAEKAFWVDENGKISNFSN